MDVINKLSKKEDLAIIVNSESTTAANAKPPQLEEGLVELNNELTCKACNIDFHQALNREDSRSKYFYSQGEGKGTLVTCKVCKIEEP